MLLFIRRVLIITLLLFLFIVLFRRSAPTKYQQVKNYLKGEKNITIKNIDETEDNITKKEKWDKKDNTTETNTNAETNQEIDNKNIPAQITNPIQSVKILNNTQNNKKEVDKKSKKTEEKNKEIEEKSKDAEKWNESKETKKEQRIDTINKKIAESPEGKKLENGESTTQQNIEKTENKKEDKQEKIPVKKEKTTILENKQTSAESNKDDTQPMKIYINNSSENYTVIKDNKTPYVIEKGIQNTNSPLSEYDREMTEYIFDTITD